jgi:TPP-dependent pyruvate/acetoin dehydrogenase alpha subunit
MTQPGPVTKLDPAAVNFYRGLLRQLVLIRRFEERAGEAYALGKIGGL